MKPIYTTIKVTSKTKTSNLPVIDQIKLLLGKVSNDETIKLETSEKLSKANLEMRSSLSNLINSVTARMRELGEKSVTVSISSRFKPYFDDILSPINGKGRFYNFTIIDKEIPIEGADYFLTMIIREKED